MGEKWSITQEEEDMYRRRLFRKAKTGDVKATRELQDTYAVRVWSAEERAALVYDNLKYKPGKEGAKKGRRAAKAAMIGES